MALQLRAGQIGSLTLSKISDVTSTAAELNILDGVTATTAELNILDGVTSTAAELNILDGVTSTAAELNILDGVTATTAELNILDGVTATAAELNILDGVTATTAELNYVDGVTSNIQTQLGGKADLSGATFTGNVSTDTSIDLSVGGNLSVSGNLTVNGSSTTVNSTTVTIDDPIFTLGGDSAPAADDNKDRGIEFRWHDGTAAKIGFFGYDDSNGVFTFIKDASNTSEVFGGTPGTALFGGLTFNGSEIITTVVDSAKTTTSYDDDASIPTVANMIDYVPKELTSLSDVTIGGTEANGNMFLYDASAGVYINVEMKQENFTAGATQVITFDATSPTGDFNHMIQVYLNGQKMRLDSGGVNFTDGHDYYFSADGELTFDNVLSSGDNVEVIFYKQQG